VAGVGGRLRKKGLWPGPGGTILNHMVHYQDRLDAAFAALSDPSRRGILEHLGRRDATISELAEAFEMTLTGIKKHVQILESAGLVTTKKVGRVRHCTLGKRRLDLEAEWMSMHRQMLEARLDRLGEFLERTKGSES
jgi:DNA-binding transcriptional ArsR family regulator